MTTTQPLIGFAQNAWFPEVSDFGTTRPFSARPPDRQRPDCAVKYPGAHHL